jgi:hypothetical protein
MCSPEEYVRLRRTMLMPVVALGMKTRVSTGALRSWHVLVVEVRGGEGKREGGKYFCHASPSFVEEERVFVADEGVRAGFGGVLVGAHFVANGFGVGTEGTWWC